MCGLTASRLRCLAAQLPEQPALMALAAISMPGCSPATAAVRQNLAAKAAELSRIARCQRLLMRWGCWLVPVALAQQLLWPLG